MPDLNSQLQGLLGTSGGSYGGGGGASAPGGPGTMAALTQIANNGSALVTNISKLISTLTGLLPFGGAFGSFTLAAAATTTVPNINVKANSVILLMPTNAAAGTLQGSAKSLYVSAISAGVSFTVATASAAAAAGTETFSFLIATPH